VDVDLPSPDLDALDQDAHQSLALREVELVDCGHDAAGEALDAVAQAVASHELVSLGDEFLALAGQSDEAVVDVGGPPRELGRFEHTGLIEISEPSAFCSRCLHAPVEPAELDGEQLVVGSRTPRRAGLLAGEQELGRDQGGSNLTEYERVEGLGADAALVAVPYLPGDV